MLLRVDGVAGTTEFTPVLGSVVIDPGTPLMLPITPFISAGGVGAGVGGTRFEFVIAS